MSASSKRNTGLRETANSQRRSPEANKHQQKTQATTGKLLTAAFRVFAREGFQAARIDTIAREAGYTRGAFYAHYKTKEDLFFALLERESLRHWTRIQEIGSQMEDEESARTALRQNFIERLSDRQWCILVLEFKLYAVRHPKLHAKLAQRFRSVNEMIKNEKLAAHWRADFFGDPDSWRIRRTALQAFLYGLSLDRAYDPQNLSQGEADSLLARIFDFVTADRAVEGSPAKATRKSRRAQRT